MSCPIVIATIMGAEGETGVQTHFQAFSKWLNSFYYKYSILTPFHAPKWKFFPIFGARYIIKPFNKTASVWWYRHWHRAFLFHTLCGVLADGTPCVVYAQCPLSAEAAMRARTSKSQRIVMVTHFNVSQAEEWVGKDEISENGWLYRFIRKFEFEFLPRLDGIVFVSDFMRRELLKRIPTLASIPYCVVPNFLPDPGDISNTNKTMADLICIGTLEPRKNQSYALEIIAAAVHSGNPISLTLVGDGPDQDNLEKLAIKLGVKPYVHFAGYVQQAASLMHRHKAYLHTANLENLPITLVEALSRSLPIFAPAVGGIPEVFSDCVEGRMIPLDNADCAAEMILDWLNSSDKMIQAGLAGRNRFLSYFESNVTAPTLYNFLDSVRLADSIENVT